MRHLGLASARAASTVDERACLSNDRCADNAPSVSEPVSEGQIARTKDAAVPKVRSNLAVRILTAFLLGPLVLLLLFRGPPWGWALLIGLSAAQVTWEMLSMTHPGDKVSRSLGAAMAAGISGAVYFSLSDERILISAVMVALGLGAMLPLVRLGNVQTAALRLLATMGAPLYVGLLLSSLILLRSEFAEQGARYVLFALLIAWMADTGGYVFGRIMGRTKLYEAVSPKKTREGLLGSIVFSVAACVVASLTYLESIPVWHALLLGLSGAVFGTAGDLVESLLKRSTGVKDSGALLPGHGGLFDRVDALLVVGPIVYLYVLWVG
jgi:phosphatidate cytidylyltransferase